MTDEGGSEHPEFHAEAPPERTAKDRRRSIIAALVGIGIAVFVFGFLLPQVIDYETVWETIKALDPIDFAVLIAAGLILFIPEGALYASLMPGMGLRHGSSAWIASTAVGTTIPAADLVVRFGMYRSWGHSVDRTGLGIVLSGLFDNIVKFSLPAIAIILIGLSGVADVSDFTVIAIIAIGVLVIMVVVIVGMVRSERFTQWLAQMVENVVNWGMARFKREPVERFSEKVVGFRDTAIEVVRSRGGWSLFFSAAGKLWAFVILWIALRIVGIGSDVLSGLEIFVVWVIVLLITAIPITPGGIGIAEVAYIWMFTQIAGDEYSDIIAAGVILFRLIQWAMPIPIGWVIVYFWRRQIKQGKLPDPYTLPRADEPEAEAA
jgi:uncharacterized protein (TIRG00374 family)